MYKVHKISDFLASQISTVLNMDKDREEVIAYGAFTIIQTIWSLALIVISGVIFNVLLEALIISFTAAVLKKYSGGAHAASPNRCAVIGAVIFTGFALMVNRLAVNSSYIILLIYNVIGFISAYYTINKFSPADTPNKPIESIEKRRRLKMKSIKTIRLLLVLTLILMLINLKLHSSTIYKSAAAICTGLVWQSLTLTSIGRFIISALDISLKKINLAIGGEKE